MASSAKAGGIRVARRLLAFVVAFAFALVLQATFAAFATFAALETDFAAAAHGARRERARKRAPASAE